MKLQGDYLFDAPVKDVWAALFDPVVLAAIMPGCEKLDLVDGAYVGDLNIKVGPVQGKFSGKVDLKDVDEPIRYTMVIDGKGPPGFMKATAKVSLEAEGSGTRIRYEADAQVGGKIASVGQRLIEASSRAITKQSLDGLNENIKIRMAAAPKAAAPAPKAEEKAEPDPAPPPVGEFAASTAPVEVPYDPPASQLPEEAAAPVILKKVDQNALAASIAKEVTKSILPMPVIVVIGLAIVGGIIYLLVR